MRPDLDRCVGGKDTGVEQTWPGRCGGGGRTGVGRPTPAPSHTWSRALRRCVWREPHVS